MKTSEIAAGGDGTTSKKPSVARNRNMPRRNPNATNTKGSGEERRNEYQGSSMEESTSEISSWTEVEDPDTGETFYWNEEDGDIRWDLE